MKRLKRKLNGVIKRLNRLHNLKLIFPFLIIPSEILKKKEKLGNERVKRRIKIGGGKKGKFLTETSNKICLGEGDK